MKEHLEGLNESQLQAVTHPSGPLLVLAGAGSGKTRVLTLRLAWLIEECGIAPWELLAVTFTNKAAEEMKARVDGLLGGRGGDCWVSTFHSSCLRILRRELDSVEGLEDHFAIYDGLAGPLIRKVRRTGPDLVFPPRRVGGADDARQLHVSAGGPQHRTVVTQSTPRRWEPNI